MPAFLLLTLLLLVTPPLAASEPQAILKAAEDLARKLATGQPGEVQVVAGPIDSSQLPACSALETSPPATPRNL
ncbi:MAG TPA: flagellar basal body P-ring formation protein FlgA, partial [Azonexus sp.]|nr:flagellar basal body P-ring formation protein FlgA [Azonexus sp.]